VSARAFVGGIGHALRGARLLYAPGVRRYVLAPLAISIAVFSLGLWGALTLVDVVVDRYLGAWPAWLAWLAWGVFAIATALVVFFTFSIVANLIASPFNGLLAAAVERHLRGLPEAPDHGPQKILAESQRALRGELKKLGYIAWRALPLVVLSLVPGLNLLAPPLWFLFGAWMLALEYLDCPFGNHDRVFPNVLSAMREERSLALGFGGAMALLSAVPLVNFLAMPIGVAGATSLYCARFAGITRAAA
jgi:CysZ protein